MGPGLSIKTAIYGNKIIIPRFIVPYHFTLSLVCAPTGLEYFARIFHALKNAYESLAIIL